MNDFFFADDLQEGASQFQQQAVKLKRKYWWENIKVISNYSTLRLSLTFLS
jgi:hypothetical protein